MKKYLAILLSITLIVIFGYNLIQHSLNIPSFDDYDATLNFIRDFYFERGSFLQKLKLLFSFHNDHCIMISRASAAMYYNLFREINFAHLVVYQNIFFIGFFIVLLAIMRQQNLLSPYTVLLVTIFLFNLSLWQVTFNYWGGIQTYTVFFFSFLSLFLLSKTDTAKDGYFIFAILCVVFAVFSFGNGILALFLGGFLLWSRKKYAALIIWSIISSGLFIFILLWRLQSHTSSPEKFHFDWMLKLLFTFLGSSLFVNPTDTITRFANIIFCMAVGGGIFGFWVWLFFKRYPNKNPLLYVLLSFPILTGILIAFSRFSTKAAGGIAPRYMFITATIPVLIILILLDLKILHKRSLKYLAVFALTIWGVSFYNNSIALNLYNNELISVIRKWKKDDKTRLIYYRDSQDYSRTLHWAIEKEVVHINEDAQHQ